MNIRFLSLAAPATAFPALGLACACGCGVFDIGTGSMYADHAGVMAYVEYDYLNQDQNWSGTSSAPAADNEDKAIRSTFMTAGGRYQFDRSWGLVVEVPYWHRELVSADEDTGEIVSHSHSAIGDIRIKGAYTGFSADMSTGLTFGVKLANGDDSYPYFDADTQIGSGSTDLLLGGYHLGRFSADNRWSYFLQAQWDQPVWHKESYRPGAEGAATAGLYFEGWSTHANLKFSPVGQLRAVYRRPDGGADALPNDTGYTRWLVSPGIEMAAGNARVYADVALPLYTNARGNQLFASELWKVNVSYYF
jgi:hypothetical protein